MPRFRVRCQRKKAPNSSINSWSETVEAESTSEAMELAKEKAKFKYPTEIVAVIKVDKL